MLILRWMRCSCALFTAFPRFHPASRWAMSFFLVCTSTRPYPPFTSHSYSAIVSFFFLSSGFWSGRGAQRRGGRVGKGRAVTRIVWGGEMVAPCSLMSCGYSSTSFLISLLPDSSELFRTPSPSLLSIRHILVRCLDSVRSCPIGGCVT